MPDTTEFHHAIVQTIRQPLLIPDEAPIEDFEVRHTFARLGNLIEDSIRYRRSDVPVSIRIAAAAASAPPGLDGP